MRFDVTVTTTETHHRVNADAVTDLLHRAAAHGQRLHIRPHTAPAEQHPVLPEGEITP